MKYIYTALLIICFASCGKFITSMDDATTKAVNAIDGAISNLSFESSEWRFVLTEALDNIPDEIKSIINNDIQNLITESIAVAGIEVRCNVDFFRARMRQDLQNLKRKILKQTLIVGDAEICQTSPPLIDMNLVANNRNSILITGYDLRNKGIKLYLLARGQTIDYSSKLSKNSNYQMTINLGGTGIPLNTNSSKILIKYKNNIISEIPIIQKVPEICKSKPHYTKSKKHTLLPVRIRGDNEFDGNGPHITCSVSVKLSADKKKLLAEMYMIAKETQSNWSTAEKRETITLYTVSDGWIIEKINSNPQTSSYTYTDRDHSIDTYNIGHGPVKRMVFVGDVGGDDIGKTQVEILFRPVSLQLKENKDCVSRFALGKAINQGIVSKKLTKDIYRQQPTMKGYTQELKLKPE